MKGLFVTFEGPEGGGKTTQIKRLAERLRSRGREVVCTREPGGTKTGEAVRSILQHNTAGEDIHEEAEALLFEASRAQLVKSVIIPALKRGACVLSDRFTDSTIAYQGYGRGLDVETLMAINRFATCGLEPDVTILLDLDVKLGLERLEKRNKMTSGQHDRFESEEVAFHDRVRAGFLELARKWPERFCVINAELGTNEVESEIWETVEEAMRADG